MSTQPLADPCRRLLSINEWRCLACGCGDRSGLGALRAPESGWDLFYLGGEFTRKAQRLAGLPALCTAKGVARTHAYAVGARYLRRFSRHLAHAPDDIARGAFHIDHQLCMEHDKADIDVYAPWYWACGQGGGRSDIEEPQQPTSLYWQSAAHAAEVPVVLLRPDDPVTEADRAALWAGADTLPGTLRDRAAFRVDQGGELKPALAKVVADAVYRGRVPCFLLHLRRRRRRRRARPDRGGAPRRLRAVPPRRRRALGALVPATQDREAPSRSAPNGST